MVQAEVQPSFRGDPPAAWFPEVLPDRRELALVAVERTRMPMVIADARLPDCPIVLANNAFLELTGYSAEEVIGRNCRFLQGPETDPAAIDELRRQLAGGDQVDIELLNYRKDGSTFWNQLAISAVHNDAGQLLYYFASQKDVSARRRAEALEATERLLLMEVDHRALNALALVKSIVRLTRSDTAEGFARAISGRIDALAHAHDLLAQTGWSGAELSRLLATEAAADSKLDAHGPSVKVPPRLVQPITLVVHELLSNARQHGAFTAPEGHVELTWESDAEGLRLHWVENCGACPAPPQDAGFGLNLIAAVVERQLAGTVAMNWQDDGLRVDLSLPWTPAEMPRTS
jgi:PAS domain S-box-containing protein